MPFTDRTDAGRRLAAELGHLASEDVVVLGLPRGGVPVAAVVADVLDAPLDVILVRKLGVPSQPELGMGAIGEGGARVLNTDIVRLARVTEADIARVEAAEREELARRARRYRGDAERVPLEGRTAVVVDDGIATGSTARAACAVARALGAARVVLATPVAPPDWGQRLGDAADELVAVETPAPFHAIGQFYDDFSQTSDEEVVEALRRHRRGEAGDGAITARDDEVVVTSAGARLGGHLTVPAGAAGLVVFAHGSGSSRHSPRNRAVAEVLHRAGLGTLLFDLLTEEEGADRANVFDIDLLGRRLAGAIAWLGDERGVDGLPIGAFGASTGAAAALWAAAEPGGGVAAVVSRGGRPDLAGDRLPRVEAPTLLIVGGDDVAVLDLNRQALARLDRGELLVVPGATHLFEEPGTLRAAAEAARDFFARHLREAGSPITSGRTGP